MVIVAEGGAAWNTLPEPPQLLAPVFIFFKAGKDFFEF
tara:strand:+ start:901 stop:1014 length:114 start_codon:yes stop_codon:yes gene_type:complete